jgi:transposase
MKVGWTILGLDVAKDSVQAELWLLGGGKRRFRFANKATGFKQLAPILAHYPDVTVHAGLEATGRYREALAHWLHGQGYRVSLLNPRRVKDYARSKGLRNKTDATGCRSHCRVCACSSSHLPALATAPG